LTRQGKRVSYFVVINMKVKPMTQYRSLGRSGLIVSPLALGTMTFGPGGWNADDATARAIFDAYLGSAGPRRFWASS
jgi:hypothetical protein